MRHRDEKGRRFSDSAAVTDVAARDRRRAILESVTIGVTVAAVVGAAISGLWLSTAQTVRENYRTHLTRLALAAAQQVDPELHERIRHPEQMDTPEYKRAVEPLRRMRLAVPGIRFLYTLVRDGQVARFILDSADPGLHNGVEDRSSVWDVSVSQQPSKMIALGEPGQPGRPTATLEPYTDPWGTFMTGYAPIFDASHRQIGAVGVDVDAREFVAYLREARQHLLLGLVPAAAMVILLAVTFYHMRLRGLVAAHEVAEAARRAQAAARLDRLTGLANRTLFMERLQHAIERVGSGHQARFVVLFLDFDHFKLVNDTMGHPAGDELLRQIAERLRGSLRASDAMSNELDGNIIARFGGDEFVILINDLRSARDAELMAERLLQALAPVYELCAGEVHSSASIGIVTSTDGLESAEAVIRNADVAMYEAKRAGRGCYVVFSDAMHTRLTRRVHIESGLRKAIGTAELELAYQPIVDLETGQMASTEVLLRWNHPQLGEIEPSEFIPIAEESGLIVPLGEWVLLSACRQLVEWRQTRPHDAPRTVSVNVSRAELALGPRLLERLRNILEQTGLPPHCLQLEVTEREVMRDPVSSKALMHRLREIGVRLAMDDFGTGTSSLACLRDYPFDCVKIDRSFVSDLAGSRDVLALIHATLTLVENLGMTSVAEGVEDISQLAVLQSLGCRYAQGYLFSHPVAADALLEAVASAPIRPVEARPPVDRPARDAA